MVDPAPAKPQPPKDNPLVQLIKTHPPAGAGIVLALLALPPLAILFLSAGDGWNGWCSASVALMGAAAVPALATFFRFSWANSAALYLCWADLIQVALRIVTTGFRPALAFPAGLAVVALLTLTSAQ